MFSYKLIIWYEFIKTITLICYLLKKKDLEIYRFGFRYINTVFVFILSRLVVRQWIMYMRSKIYLLLSLFLVFLWNQQEMPQLIRHYCICFLLFNWQFLPVDFLCLLFIVVLLFPCSQFCSQISLLPPQHLTDNIYIALLDISTKWRSNSRRTWRTNRLQQSSCLFKQWALLCKQ